MATKPATPTKPAARKPTAKKSSAATSKASKTAAKQPTKKQPAKEQPAKPAEGGVTIKDLADRLDRTPKSLRASIRRIMGGGPQVGKGGRYHWSSWDDEELKQLIEDLTKTSAEAE